MLPSTPIPDTSSLSMSSSAASSLQSDKTLIRSRASGWFRQIHRAEGITMTGILLDVGIECGRYWYRERMPGAVHPRNVQGMRSGLFCRQLQFFWTNLSKIVMMELLMLNHTDILDNYVHSLCVEKVHTSMWWSVHSCYRISTDFLWRPQHCMCAEKGRPTAI